MRQVVVSIESAPSSLYGRCGNVSPRTNDVDTFKQEHPFFDGNPRYTRMNAELEMSRLFDNNNNLIAEPEHPMKVAAIPAGTISKT